MQDSTVEGDHLSSVAQGVQGSQALERVQQLSVYIKETDHVDRHPLYLQILELVKNSGGAGATVLRGVAGYSISSRSIRSAGFADLRQNLPVLIVIVDTASQLQTMLPQITTWVQINGGLITLENLEGHQFLHPNRQR